MKRVLQSFIGLLIVALTTGCVVNHSVRSETDVISTPTDESAVIVFIRSSFILSGIGMTLFEKSEGDLKFIGSLPTPGKLAYETNPGKKVFMTYGYDADFLVGEVEANKTYYVITRPIWPSRFAPTSIRTDGRTKYNTDSEDFQKWMETTQLYELSDNGVAWFEKNKEKMTEIYDDSWVKFQEKSEEQKSERLIKP